jgi:hypothetical protein
VKVLSLSGNFGHQNAATAGLDFPAGAVMAIGGFSYRIYAICRVALGLYVVPGWTSLMVAQCIKRVSCLVTLTSNPCQGVEPKFYCCRYCRTPRTESMFA